MGGVIVCVSVGRSAPRDVRERLAPEAEDLLATRHPGIGELLVLSTCHRVELYATAEGTDAEAIEGLLELLGGSPEDRAEAAALTGVDAVAHLFRVTAGLESLIVGEPQIQAQVRRALYDARNHASAGPTLAMLVSRALRTGRRARKETALGAIGESLGTATARVLEQRLGRLEGIPGLIVGAGVAAEDAAIAASARGTTLTIASRNPVHAHALAARLDAQTGDLADLEKLLIDASFAIVAVSGGELVTHAPGSDAIVVDLSVPHAVSPSLHPITIDELPPPEGADVRTGILEATRLIADEVAALMRWNASRRETGAAIRALTSFADRVSGDEVARIARDDEDAARLRQLADRIAGKLLHRPVAALRNADARTAALLAELLGATDHLEPRDDTEEGSTP